MLLTTDTYPLGVTSKYEFLLHNFADIFKMEAQRARAAKYATVYEFTDKTV